MRRLGQKEVTQIMGIGHLGEVRRGPDGELYQWVQGVDGLGNPIGFWKKLRRGLRRVARGVRRVAPLIPGVGPAAAAALRTATPILRRAGVAGSEGLGALYQAPDGTLYQVQGLAQDEELQGLAEDEELQGLAQEDELTQVMGIGHLGEVRRGPNGELYEWVQGVDGLGNPIGFWKKLRRGLRRVARGVRRVVRRALPIVQRVAPLIPGVGPAAAAALRTATPILRRAGVAGPEGLGALYQAPDGTLYQVQGLAQDEELQGLAEDEELQGLAEDEEFQGPAEDEELQGIAEDEESEGVAENEELEGLQQGYVRETSTSGLEAYVPEQPASTRWFVPPSQSPKLWEPMW